jgi:cell division protein FtsB
MKRIASILIIVMLLFGSVAMAADADKIKLDIQAKTELFNKSLEARESAAVVWNALNDQCVQLKQDVNKLQEELKKLEVPEK